MNKRFVIRLSIGVAVGILLAGVCVGVQTYVYANDAVTLLREAKTEAGALHFDVTRTRLEQSEEAFAKAKASIRWLRPAEMLPVVGVSLRQSRELISAGLDVAQSLVSVADIGQSVLRLSGLNEQYFQEIQQGSASTVSFTDLTPETRALILARLSSSSQAFSLLAQRIGLIQRQLSDLMRLTGGGPFAEMVSAAEQELIQTQKALKAASLLTDLVPAFAGSEGSTHHLLLFLNNTELRPGGGFIGNYGVVTMNRGLVDRVQTADVYALDRLVEGRVTEPAPYPMAVYNQTPIWFFRDANWSPDFGVSAQKVLQKWSEETGFLTQEQRQQIPYASSFDGVIAFTPTFASMLLELVGPIEIAGQTFTAQNIAERLEYQVEYAYATQGIPEAQRKEIIGDMLDILVERLGDLPLSKWETVFDRIQTAFADRQLFLYHTDPDTQAVLERARWAGRYAPVTGDVQFVVDANLASLKSDPAVARTVNYTIATNAQGERVGRTAISYDHTGVYDWKTTKYRTYVRLYVPQGSTLLSVKGAMNPSGGIGSPDQSSELGMSVFGAFVIIEPGKKGEVTFEYKLADSVRSLIAKNAYTLQVFKQNGAQPFTLTLDLDFDKRVTRATPAEESSQWGDTHYVTHTTVDQDKEFQIGL